MLVKQAVQEVKIIPLGNLQKQAGEKRILPLDNTFRYLRFKAIGNFEKAGNNGNFDAFPYEYFEDEEPGFGYKSFAGKSAHYEHNCICPNTLILMDNLSYKKVQDIEIEDRVFTHTGECGEVINTFKYPQTEDLIKLKAEGVLKSLFFTKEHPLWIIKKDLKKKSVIMANSIKNNQKRKMSIDEKKSIMSNYTGEPDWIFAKDTEVGDCLVVPYLKFERETDPEIAGYDMARFLGFYTAEGSLMGNKDIWGDSLNQAIQFTFNKKEHLYIDFIHNFAKQRNIKTTEHAAQASIDFGNDTCVIVDFFSSEYANIVNMHCGRHSTRKVLSESIMKMPKDWQIEFLKAYFEGDANINEDKGIKGSTASRILALQIQEMCVMNEVWCNVKEFKQHTPNDGWVKNSFGNPIYVYNITVNESKRLFKEYFKFNKKAINSGVVRSEFGFLVLIKYKESTEYNGYVYNFEVSPQNTYTVYNVAVHNSNLKLRGSIGDLPDAYLNKFIYPKEITSQLKIASNNNNIKWRDLKGRHNDLIRTSILNLPGQKDGSIEVLMRIDTSLLKNSVLEPNVKRALERIVRMIDTGQSLACSMGCNVQNSSCTACGNSARFASDYCSHLKHRKGGITIVSANKIRDMLDKDTLRPEWLKHVVTSSFDEKEILNGLSNKGVALKNIEVNHKLSFFELSVVAVPAYAAAVQLEKYAKRTNGDRQEYLKLIREELGDDVLLDVYALLQQDGKISTMCGIR